MQTSRLEPPPRQSQSKKINIRNDILAVIIITNTADAHARTHTHTPTAWGSFGFCDMHRSSPKRGECAREPVYYYIYYLPMRYYIIIMQTRTRRRRWTPRFFPRVIL